MKECLIEFKSRSEYLVSERWIEKNTPGLMRAMVAALIYLTLLL